MKTALIAACLALAAGVTAPVAARPAQDGVKVDSETRQAVIRDLGEKMRDGYVFPEVAERTAQALAEKERKHGYDSLETAEAFAAALTEDLRRIGQDGHFGVRYDPAFVPPPESDEAPGADEIERLRRRHEQMGYGIERVARLEGNIGYLDVRSFGMPDFTGPAFEGAMRLLQGSDAVIIDLRSNGGGNAGSVAELISHFFAHGDERHLNDIYWRPTGETRQYWTNPAAETRYTGPVYLVTSNDTFSGGEEFAFDMQTQKRARIYGETTGGGANPGRGVKLAGGFTAFIPSGRAINPITHTNWEHVGVKPDVALPAAGALQAAYVAALQAAASNAEGEDKAEYAALIERAQHGEVNLPRWEAPARP